MKSEHVGKTISEAEVTHISSHGIWILSDNEELFLSYDDFPWFKDIAVGKILNITEPSSGHFYWPDLDVDLSAEIIRHPERFPMKAECFI
ncbi:MAG: integron cassette protein [Desulfobacteraceae bacterium IS3]|nr:MAG: integron cassette protein [Desulfobacteraceae bacterium IS3]